MKNYTKYHFSFVFNNSAMSGVLRKLEEQAIYFNRLGVKCVVFNRELDGEKNNIHYIKLKSKSNNQFIKSIYEIWARAFKYNLISKYLKNKSVDWMIVRYVLSDFSTIFFVRKFSNKVIFEHHSKELEELKVYDKFGIYIKFQSFFERFLPRIYSKYLKNIVAVTPDILEYQKQRFNYKKTHGLVFPNAIDEQIIVKRIKKNIENKNFNIIFSAGKFSKWHGLDILLKLIADYSGTYRIHLTLVGRLDDGQIEMIARLRASQPLVDITIEGYIKRSELFDLYDKNHIAVDSLGLNRLELKDGSTLKSKEYIARSIPFIRVTDDLSLKWTKNFTYRIHAFSNDTFNTIIQWYVGLNDVDFRENYYGAKQNITWQNSINKLIAEIEKNN